MSAAVSSSDTTRTGSTASTAAHTVRLQVRRPMGAALQRQSVEEVGDDEGRENTEKVLGRVLGELAEEASRG